MSRIRCEIVTQERAVYDQLVDTVVAPGFDGELGILPQHTALLTALEAGELVVRTGDQEESYAISGGFMEVRPDGVTVLARTAEYAEEIDVARAEAAQARAEQLLREGPPRDPDQYRSIEAALRRSRVRLRVVRRRRRRLGPGPMMETRE